MDSILARCIKRCLGSNLSEQWWRQSRLTELHHCSTQGFILGYQRTDTNTALGVSLRHRINQHHILLDTLQVARRDIWRAGIDKFAIDLVREEEQVVLLYKIANTIHLLACVEVARRVIRVTNQDTACALIYQLLELLYRRQGKAIFDSRCYRANYRTCRYGKCHIIGIRRLRNDNLVTRIETRHKGEQHRLRASRSYDNIIGREFYLVLVVVAHQLLAQRKESITRTILQNLTVDIADSIECYLWSLDIGLTDIEMIDLCATLFSLFGKRSESANW